MTREADFERIVMARQARLARLRTAILDDLETARLGFEQALKPGETNAFVWHGSMFWVDRVRHFVVPGSRDQAPPSTFSVDDDDEGNWIDIFAGEYQLEDSGSLSRMWAEVIGDGEVSPGLGKMSATRFFNLMIAQPRVNPAFGPLFWLFLGHDIGPGPKWDWDANLFGRVYPMIHRLAEYPDLVPSPAQVRQAQIAFLEGLFPGATDARSPGLSNEDWAAVCEAQLQEHQRMVDDSFFEAVLQNMDSEYRGIPFV